MKYALIGVAAIIILGLGFVFMSRKEVVAPVTTNTEVTTPSDETPAVAAERSVVMDGIYTVRTSESTLRWAGKKPLIEGYVNAGSIGIREGTIQAAGTTASGSFVIDMNTLSVSETPTKPGQESALEGHLKGDRWFNVAGFPTATFEILEVTPRVDSSETFIYDIRGNLTMKGETGELTFPATIYLDAAGVLHADASLEFDRTKWGITAGSGSFFDNLADNVIDDMVELTFSLVAERQVE